MIPRLFRPRTERMIAGVCGGLGLYFGVDPVIVRLLFVVLALATGLPLILYPILWLIMPEGSVVQPPASTRFDPQTGQPLPEEPAATGQTVRLPSEVPQAGVPAGGRSRVLAYVLVGVGALIFIDNFGELFGFDLASVAIPLCLIGLGLYLLRRAPAS